MKSAIEMVNYYGFDFYFFYILMFILFKSLFSDPTYFFFQFSTKLNFTHCSARFWLKKLLGQVHATQNIYLHNIVGTCTKESLNKENTTQIANYKKHSDLIP